MKEFSIECCTPIQRPHGGPGHEVKDFGDKKENQGIRRVTNCT